MRHAANEQVDIVLRTLPSGQHAIAEINKSALEDFGLLNHYEPLIAVCSRLHGIDGFAFAARGRSKRRGSSRKAVRIIRNMPPDSPTKTWSTTIRLGSKATLFDVAEMAHFIESDWHFLVGPDGRRHDRDWWEARYQRGPKKSDEDRQ